MPFDLHITFGGMCLLVRDYSASRLCVLMPPVSHHPHDAILLYDGRYENGSGKPGVKQVPMENLSLDLSALTTRDPLELELPGGLVDLDYITQQSVSRTLIDDADTGGRVLSKVLLAAGSPGKPSRGGRWRLGSRPPRFMATAVEWIIRDIQQEDLELTLRGLNQHSDQPTRRLRPAQDRSIRLWIFHTPPSEIPERLPPPGPTRRPVPNEVAHHFEAFYSLYSRPADTPLPRFCNLGGEGLESLRADAKPMGSELTCVAAAGTAEEPA